VHRSDAEVGIAAAEAGAAVVRARYRSSLTRIDKSPTDFATDADIEAEQSIMAVLRAARPTDGFIGEEAGATGPASTTGRTWLVDPLCGTLNYAAQTPLVAVNVALRESGHVAVAATADPLAGDVFWTTAAVPTCAATVPMNRGQPLHTGVGGLVAAADQQTHADLLAIIDQQYPTRR
jgi:fructose-1,6-bisphosphatase/inositol monophosphatase family enzyme